MTTAPPLYGDCAAAATCTIPVTTDEVEAASSSPCLPQHERTAATAECCLLRMLSAEDCVVSHLRTTSTTATHMHDNASSEPEAAHPPVWRERVAQWAYTVIDHVGADRSAVYNVLLLLDSYLDAITATGVDAAEEAASPVGIVLARCAFRSLTGTLQLQFLLCVAALPTCCVGCAVVLTDVGAAFVGEIYPGAVGADEAASKAWPASTMSARTPTRPTACCC